MKNLKNIFIAFIVLFVLSADIFAQSAWATNGNAYVSEIFRVNSNEIGRTIKFSGTIDTVGTDVDYLLSNPIEIAPYDDQITTYPFTFTGYLSGGTNSTRKITCQVWASMSRAGTYHVVDTLLTADSVATVLQKTINLNGKRYPYIKLKFLKATGNTDTDFLFYAYLYKKD